MAPRPQEIRGEGTDPRGIAVILSCGYCVIVAETSFTRSEKRRV
jgi:hypothetical protein